MDMNEEYGLTPYETKEILFYKTDNGEVRVEILLYQENLWLTQAKMAELFEVQKAAISKHLKNIFASGELQEEAVVSKMETTAADGKRYNTICTSGYSNELTETPYILKSVELYTSLSGTHLNSIILSNFTSPSNIRPTSLLFSLFHLF